MVDLFSAASIGGNNFGRFDNPEFEVLIAKAQAETDGAGETDDASTGASASTGPAMCLKCARPFSLTP